MWPIPVLVLYGTVFLPWVNRRTGGVQLDDPVLRLFKARDFSSVIFVILYVSFALAIYDLGLIRVLELSATSALVRIVTLTLTNLDPPSDGIALNDPFMRVFTKSNELDRELFYSGHTMSLWLNACSTGAPYQWALFAVCSVLLVWQKCHYTIDVAVIPLLMGFQMLI